MGELDRGVRHLTEGPPLDAGGDVAHHQQQHHDCNRGDEKNVQQRGPDLHDAGDVRRCENERSDCAVRREHRKRRDIARLIVESVEPGQTAVIALFPERIDGRSADTEPHMAAEQVRVGADDNHTVGPRDKAVVAGALGDGRERDAELPVVQRAVPRVGGGEAAELDGVAFDPRPALPQHVVPPDPDEDRAEDDERQHYEPGH